MLDERTLNRMDATALRTYIKTLHEALGHILRAAGEAQDYVRRDGTGTKRTTANDPMVQLARALTRGKVN